MSELFKFPQQVPLNMQLPAEAVFANFIADGQAVLLQQLQASVTAGHACYYLWGDSGVGKTHLLQACCHAAAQQGKTAFYGSGKEAVMEPHILWGLETLAVVCLDDLELLLGNAQWEEALFHAYNRMQVSGTLLVVASQSPPAQLSCNLVDLHSRLAASSVVQVQDITDEAKVKVLIQHAQQKGLGLTATVADFLVTHCSRNLCDLITLLERLDQASLAEQRRLTIPFVKQVLG